MDRGSSINRSRDMGTLKIPQSPDAEATLAALVRRLVEEGCAFEAEQVRGDWIIKVTGY